MTSRAAVESRDWGSANAILPADGNPLASRWPPAIKVGKTRSIEIADQGHRRCAHRRRVHCDCTLIDAMLGSVVKMRRYR